MGVALLSTTRKIHKLFHVHDTQSHIARKNFSIMTTNPKYVHLITLTFKRKSSADLYGSWKTFLFFLPDKKLFTFRQSKNLSIIRINLTVSETSLPPVNSRAFAVVSLRTYVVYNKSGTKMTNSV